jgi:hypothetical protein
VDVAKALFGFLENKDVSARLQEFAASIWEDKSVREEAEKRSLEN